MVIVYILNRSFDKLPLENKPQKSFDFIRDVDAVSNKVIEVLKDCYRCYPDDAFQKVKKFFEDDSCFYLKMLPIRRIRNEKLFRIRTGTFEKNNDGELFHIPFEKRHLVNTQRYSIPGYPMLYLAGSLFTAWCEMDKPELIGMNYVEYKFKNAEDFVDLGYPGDKVSMWEYYSLFVMYPLLIACMVRVKNSTAPFKPEYLMPQLMTKLVREQNGRFSGIVYMSNKVPELCDINSINSRNIAVCTYNCLCISGHDKSLASRMQMTDVQTLSRDMIRDSESFDGNTYVVDFSKLSSYNKSKFRDINVQMNVGWTL